MAKRTDLKKILIIGSGPIVIGQAAEFDYAGTQACRVLKDAGVDMTDPAPVEAALSLFGELLDEMEKLTEE